MQVVDKNGRIKVEITNTVDDLSVGITTVSGGVSGRVLYDNAGVLGELDLTSIYVPTSRTLTINGVAQDLSADRSWTISTGLSVGTTPISSGTIGRVLFEGTGNVLQQSSSLFWDSTNNRLGIGTSTPTFRLEVQGGDVRFANGLTIGTAGGTGWQFSANTLTLIQNGFIGVDVAGGRHFNITNTAFSTYYFRVAPTTGNILINTTTDAGFRLDVNGTARVQSALTVQGMTVGLGGGAVVSNTVVGNVAFNSNTSGQNNTVIGESAMFSNTTGTANVAVGRRALFASNSVQNVALGNDSLRFNTAANNTAVGYFSLYNNTSGASNTSIGHNAGQANTTGANNIFIGANSTGVSATESNRTWIGNSSTATTWLAGNVLINTTADAGFRLDVNGTARVSGLITANGYRITTNGEGLTAANSSVGIVSYGGNGAASGYTFTLNNQYGGGNINRNLFAVGDGFFSVSALSSGTNTINWLGVYPVINNTGGTTTSRGIYYNPTLTNLTGTTHWAFHSTSGRIRFENLPTSATGLSAGDIWNDGGTLKIV
jgi:hypothetical protein